MLPAALALASAACLLAFASCFIRPTFQFVLAKPGHLSELDFKRCSESPVKLLATDMNPTAPRKIVWGMYCRDSCFGDYADDELAHPQNHSQRSHDSMDFSNSEVRWPSLFLSAERHAGKGFAGFSAGIGVRALIFIVLFRIYFPQ